MQPHGLDGFLRSEAGRLRTGPVSMIFAEDAVDLAPTVAHHLDLGFRSLLLFLPDGVDPPADLPAAVVPIRYPVMDPGAVPDAVNRIIPQADGQWLHYGYNAEYLFYPFCETRRIGDMLAFHAEERRDAMLTYVVDLYAGDLEQAPGGVDRADAWLDRTGYYALARRDANGHPRERQLDFFGGVRWRFDELIPDASRRIDRIALFRARKGLTLLPDHRFDDQEYNTYACPWHHNLTAAIASFRTAKALRANPGTRDRVQGFRWRNSVPFQWHSRQLLDLGLMEPGQWF